MLRNLWRRYAGLSHSKLILNLSKNLKSKSTDYSKIVVDSVFKDHMLEVDWTESAGWAPPEIKPYQPLKLDPSSSVFHYCTECHEVFKVYSNLPHVLSFRPQDNLIRFNASAEAEAAGLPACDPNELLKCIDIGKEWAPQCSWASLYAWPNMIGAHAQLGVVKPKSAKIVVILLPIGPYFVGGFQPIRLYCDESYLVYAFSNKNLHKPTRNRIDASDNMHKTAKFFMTRNPQRSFTEEKKLDEKIPSESLENIKKDLDQPSSMFTVRTDMEYAATTANFEELVTTTDSFVDKSLLIKEILDTSIAYILITRPRRWGKTMNMDMIRRFLSIEVDEFGKAKEINKYRVLFQGGGIEVNGRSKILKSLAIAEINEGEYLKRNQGQHPVIFITFGSLQSEENKILSEEEMLSCIKRPIHQSYYDHQYLYWNLLKKIYNYLNY